MENEILNKVKDTQAKLKVLLQDFAKENGICVELGNASYTDILYKTKVTITFANNKESAEKMAWLKFCESSYYGKQLGLKREHYGMTIKSNGREFELVGFSERRPKCPLLIKCSQSGKLFKSKLTLSIAKQLGIEKDCLNDWSDMR